MLQAVVSTTSSTTHPAEGKDDVTGEPLTQRDDKPEFIQRRLDDYEAMTKLLSHYKDS